MKKSEIIKTLNRELKNGNKLLDKGKCAKESLEVCLEHLKLLKGISGGKVNKEDKKFETEVEKLKNRVEKFGQ